MAWADISLRDNGSGTFDVSLSGTTYLDFTGSVSGTGVGTAAIYRRLDWAGAASGTGVGTASFRRIIPITGAVSGTGVGGAAFYRIIPLTGAVSGTGVGSATFTVSTGTLKFTGTVYMTTSAGALFELVSAGAPDPRTVFDTWMMPCRATSARLGRRETEAVIGRRNLVAILR